MPSYYTYLISSLPALNFGAGVFLSLEDFFDICSRVISGDDLEKIKEAVSIPDYELSPKDTGVLKEWHNFNLSLRKELAVLRSGRKKVDPLKYAALGISTLVSTTHTAMVAYRNQNILDAERSLDLERWRFLDEISFGHYFDIHFLIIYTLKVKILNRWDGINKADRNALLKSCLIRN